MVIWVDYAMRYWMYDNSERHDFDDIGKLYGMRDFYYMYYV